jgi:hypothetical protein
MGNSPDNRLHGSVKEDLDKTKGEPDAELHLDDEKDTLYEDGLEVEDDSETLADTKGIVNRG